MANSGNINHLSKIVGHLKNQLRANLELYTWAAALLLLFCMNGDTDAPSLCVFRYIGFTHCPGCGLGHSIHNALRLHLAGSFHDHPLGIVAILIILNRIKQLSFKQKQVIQ